MKPRRFNSALAGFVAALGFAGITCVGQPPADDPSHTTQAMGGSQCAPGEPEPTRLFRQLSLDLRGTAPTMEELDAVQRAGSVTPEMIEGLLRSEAFVDQAARWHADILWPNLDGFTITMGGLRLTRGGTNPEVNLDLLEARTDEATCPATGNGNLTAASCCLPTNPTHPSCCMARHTAYDPTDPACVEKARRLGAAFTIGFGTGDRGLRGGSGSAGCDDALEYPPSRVAASDTQWLRDAEGRPYYVSPRTRQRRYYYDQDDVPLPYDDWTHCPNYCRAVMGSGPGGAFQSADFRAKERMVAGSVVTGDHPAAACPTGFTEVVNPCDNAVTGNIIDGVLRVRREGYRMMRPYWSGGRLVKMCAYESQERTNSVYTGAICNPSARIDASCGCGPQGLYCMPTQGRQSPLATRAERKVREALNEEPLRIVASVIGRDEDYYAAYTTRRSFMTGALSTLYREQSARMTGLMITPPAAISTLPNVRYEDETWHEYVRGTEHAGVLTTPAFLGRFPTWRARINRFRTALLCRPFEPPAGGLPAPDDACNREPNLAQRCGCQHCHASIEPLGAYWGRWAERSSVFLSPDTYPAYDPNCAQCANMGQLCSARCRSHYVLATPDAYGSRYAGTLYSALYRSREEMSNMERGPSALVAASLASGEMQACTVNTLWRRLIGRPMNEQETQRVLPELQRGFDASRHNYRALVRAIVNAPAYRRID
jgi:hypothetical protein